MHLENVVVDAADPQRLGQFWEAALDGERLTDAPGIYETRVQSVGGPWLDLCFQHVAERTAAPQRLKLGVAGGGEDDVARLLGLGAGRVDVAPVDADGVVLLDPEGNAFTVLDGPQPQADGGPLAALRLDSFDLDRDVRFWAWLTGWVDGGGPHTLRHASARGPLLELRAESGPKTSVKNRLHLDVRLDAGEDADEVAAGVVERGGRELDLGFGDLPWRHYADPSGNEVCVLPVPE